MVASAVNNTPEFNKERAFNLLMQLYPESRAEVVALMKLRQVRSEYSNRGRKQSRPSGYYSSDFVKATLSSLKNAIQKAESSGKFKNN